MTAESRTANAIDIKLGGRVRTRRIEIGMSQESLADRLGVTFQQVQKYEKGVNRISASRLFDIAQALEISVCDFFEGLAGGTTKPAPPRPAGADELMRLFTDIPNAKVRRRVIDLVRAMAAGESEA